MKRPVQSEQELEVSRIAARDIDGPKRCSSCLKVRPVMLLTGPDFNWCADCWSEVGE